MEESRHPPGATIAFDGVSGMVESSSGKSTLRRSTRFILTLLIVQTVCIGIGLWVQYRFEAWSLRRTLVEQSRRTLAADALQLRNTLACTNITTPADAISILQSYASSADRSALLLDANDHILASSAMPGNSPTGDTPSKASYVVVKSDKQSGPIARAIDLYLADGDHFGAIVDTAKHGEKLVVHEPQARILAQAATLSQPIASIQLLIAFWVTAVVSVAAYIFTTRFVDRIANERKKTGKHNLRHGDAMLRTRDAVIFGMAKLAESRDPDTGEHLERISTYSTMLAKAAARDPRFAHQVTPTFVRHIGLSSALHDIGKVGIRDEVLLKRGPLTCEERLHMQSHVIVGGQCLKDIERRLGSSNFLQWARQIALSHHECWDGSGYPDGLAGDTIPLAARIVAIADFYDALSSRRVYKEAFPHDYCRDQIKAAAGTRFDPRLVELWLGIERDFAEVAERMRPSEELPDDIDHESRAQQAELNWNVELPPARTPMETR